MIHFLIKLHNLILSIFIYENSYQRIIRNIDVEESDDDEYEPEEEPDSIIDDSVLFYLINRKLIFIYLDQKEIKYFLIFNQPPDIINRIKPLVPIMPLPNNYRRIFSSNTYYLLQHQCKLFFQLLVEHYLLMLDREYFKYILVIIKVL